VELASIGLADGAAEYLLSGHVSGAVLEQDSIFVLDSDAHRVRVYDSGGRYEFEFAGEGQGPGEFLIADGMWSGAETILVHDPLQNRMGRFASDGELLGEIILRRPLPLARWQRAVSPDGRVLEGALEITDRGAEIEVIEYAHDGSWQVLHRAIGPTEPRDPSPTGATAPYRSQFVWATTPSGAVALGNTDARELSIHPALGDPIVVALEGPPIPIGRDEIDARRQKAATTPLASGRARQVEFPDDKPMYRLILPDSSGRLWVLRDGASTYLRDCGADPFETDPDPGPRPCWRSRLFADVFEESTGAWLFRVEDFLSDELGMKSVFRPPLVFIAGDFLLARVTDQAGTVVIKKFRIEGS